MAYMKPRSLTNFEAFLGTLNRRRGLTGGAEGFDTSDLPIEDAARWAADILQSGDVRLDQLSIIAKEAFGLDDKPALKAVLDTLVEKGFLARNDVAPDNPVYRLTDYARKALDYFRIA